MPKHKIQCTICGENTNKFIFIDEGSESIPVCDKHSQECMTRQFDKIYADKFIKPLVKIMNSRFN